MSIEICDGCDFPYLSIQIRYFHIFNVGLHRAKARFYTMLYSWFSCDVTYLSGGQL